MSYVVFIFRYIYYVENESKGNETKEYSQYCNIHINIVIQYKAL